MAVLEESEKACVTRLRLFYKDRAPMLLGTVMTALGKLMIFCIFQSWGALIPRRCFRVLSLSSNWTDNLLGGANGVDRMLDHYAPFIEKCLWRSHKKDSFWYTFSSVAHQAFDSKHVLNHVWLLSWDPETTRQSQTSLCMQGKIFVTHLTNHHPTERKLYQHRPQTVEKKQNWVYSIQHSTAWPYNEGNQKPRWKQKHV